MMNGQPQDRNLRETHTKADLSWTARPTVTI